MTYWDGENLTHSPLALSNIQFSVPVSQSAVEGNNASLKDEFNYNKSKVVTLCNEICRIFKEKTRNEVEMYGFSYLPVPYGNGRVDSTRHKPDVEDGMKFLGHSKDADTDQRELFIMSDTLLEDGSPVLHNPDHRVYMLSNSSEVRKLYKIVRERRAAEETPREREDYINEVMQEYLQRYTLLKSFSPVELESELTKMAKILLVEDQETSYNNVAAIPENIGELIPCKWAHCRFQAIKQIDNEMSRFVGVRPLPSSVDDEELMRNEPFRATQDDDKRLCYRWICICPRSMQYGFCSHIFFCQHCEFLSHSPIPVSVCTRSLNTGSGRRGRPRSSIQPALVIEPENTTTV